MGYLFFYLMMCSAIFAASKSQEPQPNIKILADQMDCDQDKNVCIARGNASAEKMNEPKKKTIHAHEIQAHFHKDSAGKTQIKKLEAHGNVVIHMDETIAKSHKAEYMPETEVAHLIKDVRITEGKNQLEGGHGTLNLKTGTYQIKNGDGKQVQALIYSKEISKKDG